MRAPWPWRPATALRLARISRSRSRSGGGSIRRPLARLQLAEAHLLQGDLDAAAAELGRVPFEPVRPVDLPDTLVPRMSRLQGLVAEARGDPALALRRLARQRPSWRRRLATEGGDRDAFGAAIADLGRVPVGGLVEPALELGRVLAERARVLAAPGVPTRRPRRPARRWSSPTRCASTATAPRRPP